MKREDFPILNTGIIYFDNGATSLKPKCMVDSINDYYLNYTANAHRGDYDNSLKVDAYYDHTRKLVSEFLNAKKEEIVFTSGTTDSLNRVVFGFFKYYLEENDEVLLTRSEHASNILPWFELADQIGIKVSYIELDENHHVTLENVKASITEHTKVISLAEITNVIGDVRPIEEITKYAHEHGIYVVCDGAQSVAHRKTDVKKSDVDFLAFSAHKMLGPTGLGILYGKEELLKKMHPVQFGGGMNASFLPDSTRTYEEVPELFEAGTQHIAGIIGFGKVIEYLNEIGMDHIEQHERDLREYAIKRLKEIPEITIYNEKSNSGILAINYKNIFAQDLAIYLNKYHICVRAGSHCAKILKEEIGIKNTCRISFYFYNTKEEIDHMIEALKNPKIKEELF